jgi:hypothetical protein
MMWMDVRPEIVGVGKDQGEIFRFAYKVRGLLAYYVLISGHSLFGTMTQTSGTLLRSNSFPDLITSPFS